MKRVLSIGVLLLVFSLGSLANEYIRNDTGTRACAVEVCFSQPVTLAELSGVFTTITADFEDPIRDEFSSAFMLAGGSIGPGQRVLLSWTPASADLIGYWWFPNSPLIMRRTSTALPEDVTIENLQFANVMWYWDWFLDGLTESYIAQKFQELENAGWGGVSIDYHVFMDSVDSTDIFKEHRETPLYVLRTPTDAELERVLRIITENTGLAIEIRIQINIVTDPVTRSNRRCELHPDNPRLFFDELFEEIKPVIELCNEYGVTVFTPMVELDPLEIYTSEIHRLLDRLDPLFDGWFSISQSTNNYIVGGRFDCSAGRFWGWEDADGRPLIIGLNCNEPPLADSSDASEESMREAMVEMWEHAICYYRETFPGQYIWFGEMAASKNQGTSLGHDATHWRDTAPLAIDEMKRVCYAMLRGAQDLGVDGYVFQYFWFYPEDPGINLFHLLIPYEVEPYLAGLLRTDWDHTKPCDTDEASDSEAPPESPLGVDSDSDGVPEDQDYCPDWPGDLDMNGY